MAFLRGRVVCRLLPLQWATMDSYSLLQLQRGLLNGPQSVPLIHSWSADLHWGGGSGGDGQFPGGGDQISYKIMKTFRNKYKTIACAIFFSSLGTTKTPISLVFSVAKSETRNIWIFNKQRNSTNIAKCQHPLFNTTIVSVLGLKNELVPVKKFRNDL